MGQQVYDYTRQFEEIRSDTGTFASSIMRKVYGWMCAGLVVSGAVAWYCASSGATLRLLGNSGFMTVCIVAEIALVLVLSMAIQKLAPALAALIFIGYAALNGLTLSTIFFVYELPTIQSAFFITAGMFAGLAVYGTVTKRDLSGVGSIMGMALWGVVLLALVNIFMRSARLDWALSLVAILVFTGLTAWDAQKVKNVASAVSAGERDEAVASRLGIIFALQLYLDFVNLFIHLLSILGNGKRR